MSHDIKHNISNTSIWKRGLYMLLFAFFYGIAKFVLFAVVVIQFLLKLLTSETNDQLLKLGQSLTTYMYQILSFLSFNTENHAYPFADWPEGEPATGQASQVEDKSNQKTDET